LRQTGAQAARDGTNCPELSIGATSAIAKALIADFYDALDAHCDIFAGGYNECGDRATDWS
jgi:hypothetical protein